LPIYQALALGIVQGLTEFLPVSSTAHLYLIRWLCRWDTEGLDLDIMLHAGTLLAVLAYFFPVWLRIAGDPEMLGRFALASVPVGITGLLFDRAARTAWRNPYVIGGMLMAVGVLLGLADTAGARSRGFSAFATSDALIIGAAQALAIIPGASRSGLTIAAALFLGFERPPAAAISFLLSAPPIAAASGKTLVTLHRAGRLGALFNLPFAAGVGASAVSGYLVIGFLLSYLEFDGLRPFAYYRLVFGIIVVALAFIRRPPR
jgi:undecaprenyl-diphosphatase